MQYLWSLYQSVPTHHNCILVFSIKWQKFPDTKLKPLKMHIFQPGVHGVIRFCTASVFNSDKHKRPSTKALQSKCLKVVLVKRRLILHEIWEILTEKRFVKNPPRRASTFRNSGKRRFSQVSGLLKSSEDFPKLT